MSVCLWGKRLNDRLGPKWPRWGRHCCKIEGVKRALRIGVLTPVVSVDPRQALDASAAMVADMIFESPFAARDEEGFRAPVLFGDRLRGESSLIGRGVYSAQVAVTLFSRRGDLGSKRALGDQALFG